MILDFIYDNPSTVSEARGRRPPVDWRVDLAYWKSHKEIRNVEYVGSSRTLVYRYAQPQTEQSTFFTEFLEEEGPHDKVVERPSPDVVMSEYVPPSTADLFKHLSGFGENTNYGGGPLKVSMSDMLDELGRLENDRPVIEDWLDPDALLRVRVPAATSPGLRWKKLGYKTKRDALLPAIMEARRVMGLMVEREQEYTVPPAGVAGRGKRVAMERPDDAERKEGRLIVMPDLVRHLMGSIGSGPYMALQRGLDKSKGGVLLGMGPFSENYERIAKWAKGAKKYIFMDFKKFDQRIPRRVLRAVMYHIRRAFRKTRGSGAYWASEFRHLVDTEIAMPDGSVYRKRMGVASGDPWTSLADSYAGYVMIKMACDALGWDVKVWTFGDDSIVAVYNDVGEGVDPLLALTEMIRKEFGAHISPEKSYATDNLVGIDGEPEIRATGSFLSMYFYATPMGIRPTRSIQDLYELFLKPEKNRGTVEWEVTRTSMAYLLFYYNDQARYLLECYWDWLHRRFKIPELTGTRDDLALLRELDIPWRLFRKEWLSRLPRPSEVETLYRDGHTNFFPPALWGIVYSKDLELPGGNDL
ncbi:RNA-dependent RNA polymerase [Trichoderma harzianum mycovirus 1]|uniref:RNA-dependent RNA polymerase n=1 Tax=Trichoderma harzianum mycovirus 1 TaxID=2487095 RepID=A0A4P2UP36_9VIRU|nr:RNA-dependent RNA polymerase [Trichoderma harzianum mycovirus 1]